ncbi:MAG: hypothetical protein J6Y24_04140 [Bacteroidales bacterium]|nr:hypothetical protein [Bacteroidales bacterium]
MTLTDSQIKIMQEDMISELVMLLMERWNYSMSDALDTIYNSETFTHLNDKNTGLYYQSPGYVFSFLDNELTKGCFC